MADHRKSEADSNSLAAIEEIVRIAGRPISLREMIDRLDAEQTAAETLEPEAAEAFRSVSPSKRVN